MNMIQAHAHTFRLLLGYCWLGLLFPVTQVAGADSAPKSITVPQVPEGRARLMEERMLSKGTAEQGLTLTAEHYFTSSAHSICRYDTQWKLLEGEGDPHRRREPFGSSASSRRVSVGRTVERASR